MKRRNGKMSERETEFAPVQRVVVRLGFWISDELSTPIYFHVGGASHPIQQSTRQAPQLHIASEVRYTIAVTALAHRLCAVMVVERPSFISTGSGYIVIGEFPECWRRT